MKRCWYARTLPKPLRTAIHFSAVSAEFRANRAIRQLEISSPTGELHGETYFLARAMPVASRNLVSGMYSRFGPLRYWQLGQRRRHFFEICDRLIAAAELTERKGVAA